MIIRILMFVLTICSCSAQQASFFYLANPQVESVSIVDANIKNLTQAPDRFSKDYESYETHALPLINEPVFNEQLTIPKIVTSLTFRIGDQYFIATIPATIPDEILLQVTKTDQGYALSSPKNSEHTITLTPIKAAAPQDIGTL